MNSSSDKSVLFCAFSWLLVLDWLFVHRLFVYVVFSNAVDVFRGIVMEKTSVKDLI